MTETYVEFRERNEHEGETWSFWLRYEGNEAELALLKLRLFDQDAETQHQYAFTGRELSELGVETLLEAFRDEDMGYMPRHQRVDGTFTCPKDLGQYATALYKGEIVKYFREGDI